MKQYIKEAKRMQKLAGIINEDSINENEELLEKFWSTTDSKETSFGSGPKEDPKPTYSGQSGLSKLADANALSQGFYKKAGEILKTKKLSSKEAADELNKIYNELQKNAGDKDKIEKLIPVLQATLDKIPNK